MGARQKMALKHMKYNRYILLRYTIAGFFFANLNWFIFMLPSRSVVMMLPLIMLFLALLPIQELFKLYSQPEGVTLKMTSLYFVAQLVVNGFLISLSFYSPTFTIVFPFMNVNLHGVLGTVAILIIGMMLSLLCLKKIKAIQLNHDRGYKLFLDFKKSMKASESYGE